MNCWVSRLRQPHPHPAALIPKVLHPFPIPQARQSHGAQRVCSCVEPPRQSSRSGGDSIAGAEGFNPGLGIKGWGSARLMCKHASALFCSHRDSLGSMEVIGTFSLEGSVSDAEHNCGSHTLCVLAKQHKP